MEIPGVDRERYRRDVLTLRSALFDAAIDQPRPVRISRDELLDRVPGEWRTRLELLSAQEFAAPSHYEPIRTTVDELTRVVDDNVTGYVALVGSPGSGKSTLLSQELRSRGDVVARYYAYVRGRSDLGTVRGNAAAFLHDLVLTLERGGLPRGPAPVDFDIPALTRRLERHLAELGRRYAEKTERAIIMVDGLDHVEREVERDKSLLRYLPRPDALPTGVLFVVGSQSIKMLDAEIQVHLAEVGRTVTMQGLDRQATARLVEAWGDGVDPSAVYETTRGHPLLVDYVLRELSDVDPAERAQHLAAIPPYGGDVAVLYERLWQHVAGDAELVELLALAARIRVPVDVGWLRDRGQSAAVVRRLREKLAHLFRRQGERWHFFHDSFRVFLQRRTTMADPTDDPDPAEDRRYHRDLAAMCEANGKPHPMSWETLFHLAAADEHRAVLDLAAPAYFRSQTLALRPPELIAADIRMAARSLAVEQDPMALVRIVISAGELTQRGYHLPERDQLVDILFGTGHWETVVDLMDSERDGYGSDDSRTLRLGIAARLHRIGHAEEGRRLFEANEPLELLAGGDLARPTRGPYKLLYAWAEAAVLFRSADAMIAAVGRVRVPPESVLGGGPRDDDRTDAVRAWMLAHGARSAHRAGLHAAADALQAELDPGDDEHRVPWTWLVLQRVHGGDADAHLDAVVGGVEPGQLDPEMRLFVADSLARHGRVDDARHWIDGLEQPPLSDAMSLRTLWKGELDRYRLARLGSLFGERPHPDEVVPAAEAEHVWGYVHVARIVIMIAQLDGLAWAGETLSPSQFVAAAKPVLRRLATRGSEWTVASTLRQIRADAVAQLLMVAHEHGPAVAAALWEEIERRWDESPSLIVSEGHRVLPVALAGGVVAGQLVRARFGELVEALDETTEAQEMARALGEAALTAIGLGEPGEAWRLLERSVAASLAVYERKDYQLGDWIGLLGPLLESEEGPALARWLCGALGELRRDTGGVQANDAADPLVRGESRRRPGHAWRIGQWLEDKLVVDRDDRQLLLLAANTDAAASELWWIVLADATVPIAAEPLGSELVAAARTGVESRGNGWVAERLRTVAERARVEGPPSARAGWIEAVADAAVACGIELELVGLVVEDHPDRRPPRTRMRGTGEEERDAFLAAHSTVDELVSGVEAAHAGGESSEWGEALERLAPGLDRSGIERVLGNTGERVGDLLTLAKRSLEIGATDLARRLAERVLAIAEPRGWRRHYDGGSVLQAMMVLWRLDPEPARDLAYRRFAADASTDQFLLSELSQDLAQYLDLFGVNDRLALAREVDAYVRVLVRDPSPVPPAHGSCDERALDGVLAASLVELLVSRHRLAVTTAQRALGAALQHGLEPVTAALSARLAEDDDEVALRILSVLDAAAVDGAELADAVLDALEPWATADNLAVRVAARDVLGYEIERRPSCPSDSCPRPTSSLCPAPRRSRAWRTPSRSATTISRASRSHQPVSSSASPSTPASTSACWRRASSCWRASSRPASPPASRTGASPCSAGRSTRRRSFCGMPRHCAVPLNSSTPDASMPTPLSRSRWAGCTTRRSSAGGLAYSPRLCPLRLPARLATGSPSTAGSKISLGPNPGLRAKLTAGRLSPSTRMCGTSTARCRVSDAGSASPRARMSRAPSPRSYDPCASRTCRL